MLDVRLLVLSAAFAASLCLAAPVDSRTAPPRFSGDRSALALVDRVNRAYARVPAVRVGGRVGGASMAFTLVLDHARVTAEYAVIRAGRVRTELVGSVRGGSWMRREPRRCWTKLGPADPLALEDLGRPLLSSGGRLLRPRLRGGTIVLVVRDPTGARSEYRLDRRSLRVRTARFSAGGRVVMTMWFRELAAQPRLPVATPRC